MSWCVWLPACVLSYTVGYVVGRHMMFKWGKQQGLEELPELWIERAVKLVLGFLRGGRK